MIPIDDLLEETTTVLDAINVSAAAIVVSRGRVRGRGARNSSRGGVRNQQPDVSDSTTPSRQDSGAHAADERRETGGFRNSGYLLDSSVRKVSSSKLYYGRGTQAENYLTDDSAGVSPGQQKRSSRSVGAQNRGEASEEPRNIDDRTKSPIASANARPSVPIAARRGKGEGSGRGRGRDEPPERREGDGKTHYPTASDNSATTDSSPVRGGGGRGRRRRKKRIESRRVYGYFRCAKCHKSWESSHTYTLEGSTDVSV